MNLSLAFSAAGMTTRSRKTASRKLLLALACAGALGSAHAAPPACALEPADLQKAFGVAFDKGQADPAGGMGTGCKYNTVGGSAAKGTDFSVWLGIIPTGGQMDMWRTMTAGGPKAKLNPVAGDPDKAVTVQQKPDVPPFPSVMYQRGDLLVVLNLTGGAPRGDAKAEAAFIEQMNGKLLKVRRVP